MTSAYSSETAAMTLGSREPRMKLCSGRRVFFLRPSEIRWVEGEGNYCRVHTAKASFLVREVVHAFALRFASHGLIRVHRSAIVNVAHVLELRRKSRYTNVVVLNDGSEVPLAPDYRSELERAICGD